MPREISSGLTFFYKFIFPGFWITGFGAGSLAITVAGDRFGGSPPPWLFPIAWVFGTTLAWHLCIKLKRVRLANTDLHLSNFHSEIVVPLIELEGISYCWWSNPRRVTLTFSTENKFGRRITFMPQRNPRPFTLPWKPHPIVVELRELVRRVAPERSAAGFPPFPE